MNKNIFLRQAVILAGGYGKRLGNITKRTPKPLINIDKGISFLDHQITYLNQFGFKEILILCSYKYSFFKRKYHNKKILNTKVRCLKEKKKLGTGGALLNSRKYLDENFFLCNGDTHFDINLVSLYSKFKKYNKSIIAVNQNLEKKNIKPLNLHGNKKEFLNKTTKDKYSFYSSGYGILKKNCFNKFRTKFHNLEFDLYNHLIKNNKLKFVKFNSKLIDIGTPRDLNNAKLFFKKYKNRFYLLLDRDGVINIDFGYINTFKKIVFNKKIFQIIKHCNNLKIPIFVITNQSGIARGMFKEKELININDKISEYLLSKDLYINKFYYCPHHIDGKVLKYIKLCECRKPKIGLIKILKKEWYLSSNNCLMIGDKSIDKEFAKNLKCDFLYVKNNKIDVSKVINKINNYV